MRLLSIRIIAGLLMLSWPVLTSHAFLQHVDLIHEVHTHHGEDHSHEHHADNHAFADGICIQTSIKKLNVGNDSDRNPLSGFDGMAVLKHTLSEGSVTGKSSLSPPTSAPSDLIPTWQFRLRHALPARAPSLLS